MVVEVSEELTPEKEAMEKELAKNIAKVDKDGDPEGKLGLEKKEITSFLGEIEEL